MASQARTVLGKEHLRIFLAGKEQWNALVDQHPEADVDFSDANFASLRTRGERLNFSDYKFPKLGRVDFSRVNFGKGGVFFDRGKFGDGAVDFSEAQFGEGVVSFDGAQFGEGDVSFWQAQFGEGAVSFDGAQFGDGGVSFGEAQFGEGDVSFWRSQFGDGAVDFRDAQFGEGEVDFSGVNFGEGDVSFRRSQFGEGDVSFHEVQFGDGAVDFRYAQFGEGDVSFVGAQFGDGAVDFRDAQFGEGDVSFVGAQFGDGAVDFRDAQFGEGNVSFVGAQFGEGNVSFVGAQFGEGAVDFRDAQFGEGNVSFRQAQFGKGAVFFERSQFGEGAVDFRGAQFGEGDVDFSKARFGEGAVDFSKARLGKGNVSFDEARFGEGGVSFWQAEFGEGRVSFFETQFGEGDVSFEGAEFGDGTVSFVGADFKSDTVSFVDAKFCEGYVFFGRTDFGNGKVLFAGTHFGEGDVNFWQARFGEGDVLFDGAEFGEGDVSFEGAQFGGRLTAFTGVTMPRGQLGFERCLFAGSAVFNGLRGVAGLKALSFRHSLFKSPLDISGNAFPCVPDLSNTQLNNQLLLDFSCQVKSIAEKKTASFFPLLNWLIFLLCLGLQSIAQRVVTSSLFKRFVLPVRLRQMLRLLVPCSSSWRAGLKESEKEAIMEEASALCRLKELAEGNRDHDKAHEFYRQEMRARRLLMTSELAEMLDHAFDAIADYGNSISRPCLALLIITGLFAIIYWLCALGVGDASFWSGQTFFGALLYSMSQILPFVSSRRLAESESLRSLFTAATEVTENECTKGAIVSVDGLPILDVPNLIVALSMLQGVLSFVLLFLVGLGLRNRFRL